MDSRWLKLQFETNPDKSKADLARVLGLEPSAVSKILSGSRQIKAQEYHRMRHFFGLPTDGGRATTSPASSSFVLQPLSGEEGLQEGYQSAGDWVIPADILSRRTKSPPDQIRIFNVSDSMMEPDYKREEAVLVDLSERTPSPPGAFIVSDGFGYMLRHCAFVPRSSPPKVKIAALNAVFQPQALDLEDFLIVGRVIARLQWI